VVTKNVALFRNNVLSLREETTTMDLNFTFLAVAVFLIQGLAYAEIKPNLETLRLVQVVFRHGDRTPTESYPNDLYKNSSEFWPIGLGQLTDVGKQQQYLLGRYLRSRYDGFIPPEYRTGEISIISSYFERTVMSLESNLAGLFQPSNKSTNWNPDLLWTPIPFQTIPKYEDNILAFKKPCAREDQLMDEIDLLPLKSEDQELIDYIRGKAGLPETAVLDDILKVEDTLYITMVKNMTQPPWVTPDILTNFRRIRVEAEHRSMSTPELRRLRGGPLIGHFTEILKNRSEGRDNKLKLAMRSAHDTTLTRFMDTLGIDYNIWPVYATSIMIELHENPENKFWVEMFYRNDTTRDPITLKLPQCEEQCPLSEFISIANPLIPDDWTKECLATDDQQIDLFSQPSVIILAIVALIAFCMGIWLLVKAARNGSCCFARKSRKYSIQYEEI
jgi:hypothetical protein